jgi:hypothetical protein
MSVPLGVPYDAYPYGSLRPSTYCRLLGTLLLLLLRLLAPSLLSTYIHTYIHTYIRVYKHKCMYIYVCVHVTHRYIHYVLHTYTHAYPHTCMHAYKISLLMCVACTARFLIRSFSLVSYFYFKKTMRNSQMCD